MKMGNGNEDKLYRAFRRAIKPSKLVEIYNTMLEQYECLEHAYMSIEDFVNIHGFTPRYVRTIVFREGETTIKDKPTTQTPIVYNEVDECFTLFYDDVSFEEMYKWLTIKSKQEEIVEYVQILEEISKEMQ